VTLQEPTDILEPVESTLTWERLSIGRGYAFPMVLLVHDMSNASPHVEVMFAQRLSLWIPDLHSLREHVTSNWRALMLKLLMPSESIPTV
jgi:hypothetical protein